MVPVRIGTDATLPNGRDFPFLGVSGRGRMVPAPPSISILGSQMASWESGTLTITYRLLTELEVTALHEEEEF